MDVTTYRKQVTEALQQAAAGGSSYHEALDKSKSAGERQAALANTTGWPDEEAFAGLLDIVRDPDEAPALRGKSLQAIANRIAGSPQHIDMLLTILRDRAEPAELRLAALRVLQVLSFSSQALIAKRPDYLATLRGLVDDDNADLRGQAIEILAQEKDEYVQRRLIEGLENRSKARVGPAKAIQLLGYDIHAEHYPMLRDIVSRPASRAAKREALRLLAADPGSKDMLAGMFLDKAQHAELRKLSGIALQTLAPSEFEGYARQIVADDDEDDGLRSTCVSALTHFGSPATMRGDDAFNAYVGQLMETSPSEELREASARYMAKAGG